MQSRLISTDEAEDVACSVRHALRCMQFVDTDPQAWKWIMLALHSALQGACICHLTTTAAPIGAVTETNAKKWHDYFASLNSPQRDEQPKTELLALPDLLKKLRKPDVARMAHSKAIPISDAELAWLKRFHNEFRNQFIHFAPQGWTIDVSGVPELSKLIARIISDIEESGWGFRHLSKDKRLALSSDLVLLSKLAETDK